MTGSTERSRPKPPSGVSTITAGQYSAPATALSAALISSATSFWRIVSTPDASAAPVSLRSACRYRPKRPCSIADAIATAPVAAASASADSTCGTSGANHATPWSTLYGNESSCASK